MIPKYRAYSVKEKSMWHVRILNIDQEVAWLVEFGKEGESEQAFPCSFENCHLMQSTGLKDKNGVEIYEYDIVQSDHYFKYQVVFKGDCWRCEPLKNKRFKNRFIGGDLEVIGNIWENHELLEVEE